jgi:hypothetical protein
VIAFLIRPSSASNSLFSPRRDPVLVERLHEVVDERVELVIADVHAFVRVGHAAAAVGAGAAGPIAEQFDQTVPSTAACRCCESAR